MEIPRSTDLFPVKGFSREAILCALLNMRTFNRDGERLPTGDASPEFTLGRLALHIEHARRELFDTYDGDPLGDQYFLEQLAVPVVFHPTDGGFDVDLSRYNALHGPELGQIALIYLCQTEQTDTRHFRRTLAAADAAAASAPSPVMEGVEP